MGYEFSVYIQCGIDCNVRSRYDRISVAAISLTHSWLLVTLDITYKQKIVTIVITITACCISLL